MKSSPKPSAKPQRPYFSSGPCAKHPGWEPSLLTTALTGRSHRSAAGRERLKHAINATKRALKLPRGYEVAIVPGSDTGAFELAMWNLLGPRGVDVFAWDVFGRIWLRDALDELKLDVRTFDAEPGTLPPLTKADFTRDVLFTWNGTTTGTRIPNAEWIPSDRAGLTFCDATSALFAEAIDISKIDCLTFSWQKSLGGEAAHGMLVLSPRALERLASHRPAWPIPKVFRLRNPNGEIMHDVFEGVTINTPSMLCVEDYLDALRWAEDIGGIDALIARARANALHIYAWLDRSRIFKGLAVDPATRSSTAVTMRFADPRIAANSDLGHAVMSGLTQRLDAEGVAHDIAAYRGMPPGLRIWCGPTVNEEDIVLLLPWVDWAYHEALHAQGLATA